MAEIAVVKGDDKAPTTPGIYGYDGGNQILVFALDPEGQWWVWNEGQGVHKCEWDYISQALGVWNLMLIEEAQ